MSHAMWRSHSVSGIPRRPERPRHVIARVIGDYQERRFAVFIVDADRRGIITRQQDIRPSVIGTTLAESQNHRRSASGAYATWRGKCMKTMLCGLKCRFSPSRHVTAYYYKDAGCLR